MFLQDAQQLHLRREGHVTDFVEQDRAALGRLEDAWPIEHRPGKRAARVSEQLAFDQGIGEGAAVDGDERTLRARGSAMDETSESFFADAAFSSDQNGGID